MISRRKLIPALTLGFGFPKLAFPSGADIQTCSLAVVGSGAAGLSAARSAASLGLKDIVVLEREPFVGGSSAICGGALAVSETEFQRSRGIVDSDEVFFEDMMREGNRRNIPELVKAHIQTVKRPYAWILSQGLKPGALMAASGMSIPRSHMFSSSQIIQLLLKECREKGVAVKTGCRARGLITDETGCVAGLFYEQVGKIKTVLAEKGVVLASGGFSRNKALLARYCPSMMDVAKVSCIGAEGDGLIMGLELGAQTADMEFIKASYGFSLNPSRIRDFTTVYYSGAIIVNSEGKRFVDESSSYKDIGQKSLLPANRRSFIVFDEAIRQAQMKRRVIDRELWSPFDRGESPGYAFSAENLEELARKAGIKPQGLAKTVSLYNRSILKGCDPEFGRESLSSGYGKPVPIEEAPFYVMPAMAAVMGTYGGLLIDEKARVIGRDAKPIPNLYAAGEITGGFHGENYITGTGFGKALSFGLIAGETAAGGY